LSVAEEVYDEIRDALTGSAVDEPSAIDHMSAAINAAVILAAAGFVFWLARKLLDNK
jgi:hypothetical protein